MSGITVELSGLDADLWEVFKRGGAWVAHSEYMKVVAENAKLRELVALMYRDMQGVLDMSTDTVWVDDFSTLRDEMDYHMQDMAELGMPPADYERRMRELGAEVDE